ncbi:hypothetical protein ACXJJ3_08655 [Kribbella sp. WER1]|uniref:hypothetical protein n=1 Tax=Kribbella sp. NPDC059898 TaxID=3346995 RepID=UPI003654CA4A
MTDPELADQADALARAVDQLSTSVDNLAASQRRVKHAVAGIVATLALVVALGVVLAFVASDARRASQRAEEANSLSERNAQAAKVTCESSNEARRVSRQLWTYVLDVTTKGQQLTAEQLRQVRTFRAYLATVYADRDCSSPGPTPVRPGTASPSR